MFIGLLNESQQEALCRIVQFLSRVDGNEDAAEAALSAALLEESSLEKVPPAAKDGDEVEALLPKFDEAQAKHVLLLESIGIILADNKITHEEQLALDLLARGLEIDPGWMERARDWVQRSLELQREGRSLLA